MLWVFFWPKQGGEDLYLPYPEAPPVWQLENILQMPSREQNHPPKKPLVE